MTTGSATRADRLRLLGRIDLARRATDLLHDKEEVLERERVRLRAHATRAMERWERACAEADAALVRARMLGATDELDRLTSSGPATAVVSAEWSHSMGIDYPGDVACEPGPIPAVSSTAALLPAAVAFRAALQAAATAASASEAMRRLDVELANTRRRRRAVEEHRLPELEAAERSLELRLDEMDREEALRTRIAIERKERT